MIEEAKIESDERGFVLCLTGDFTVECQRYLDHEGATLCLRLPQDAAIQLHAQARSEIGPWLAEMEYEHDAFLTASPAERARVLGTPAEDIADAMLEAADLARKRDRENA